MNFWEDQALLNQSRLRRGGRAVSLRLCLAIAEEVSVDVLIQL